MTEFENKRTLGFPWKKVEAQMKDAVETVMVKIPRRIRTDKDIVVLLNAPESNEGFYHSRAVYTRNNNNMEGHFEIQKLYRSGTNNWLFNVLDVEDARLPVIADEVTAGKIKHVSTTVAAFEGGFSLQLLKGRPLVFELQQITPPLFRKTLHIPGTIRR